MSSTPRRLVTAERRDDDTVDGSLRPQRLAEFIGQQQARSNLSVFIEAARTRREPLDHVLFVGPPGLGKTTLAQIVARELGVNFRATSGPVIAKAWDLAALLTNLEDRDVLFIDEIHRLNPAVEEILYPAMEDFQLDLIIGEGPAARSVKIDLEHGQRTIRQFSVYFSVSFDLNIIAHPPEKVVGGTRRSPRARSDLRRSRIVNLDIKQSRTAPNDLLHFLGTVIIEPRCHSKTRAQRRAYHSCACRCADEGEFRQLQSQTARLWPLVDDNVEAIIFHRRIKILFNCGLEAVDLVDEKHVAFFQTREQTC